MKIRKLLSGAAAAALAFSAVSVVSVVASADEVDVWGEKGLVMNQDKLSQADVDISKYEGKTLTVTFEITANVGEKWHVANTVVKYGNDEKKEVIQLCKDYDGGDWVNEHVKNSIENGSTFTYDIDVPVGGMFEVRYGGFTDEYVLKSVTLKCEGKTIASSDADGNISAEKPGNSDTEKPGNSDTEKPGNSDTEKPGNSDTEKPGNSDTEKPDNNVNTGIEGVGVFAGIAGLAACAVVVSRKRK